MPISSNTGLRQLVHSACCGVCSIWGCGSSLELMVGSADCDNASFRGQKTSDISFGIYGLGSELLGLGLHGAGPLVGLPYHSFQFLDHTNHTVGTMGGSCQLGLAAGIKTDTSSPSSKFEKRARTSCCCFCCTWPF